MSHRADPSFLERETRLRAIQRLHLTLLIAAENDGMLWSIQIKADHIFEFLRKSRIIGDFESPPLRCFKWVTGRAVEAGDGRL